MQSPFSIEQRNKALRATDKQMLKEGMSPLKIAKGHLDDASTALDSIDTNMTSISDGFNLQTLEVRTRRARVLARYSRMQARKDQSA